VLIMGARLVLDRTSGSVVLRLGSAEMPLITATLIVSLNMDNAQANHQTLVAWRMRFLGKHV
jgi:hypothetical protein